MDTEEVFIAAYALAAPDIATAHSESAWAALLNGDIDAALAAQPKFLNTKTGETISRRAAERHFAATASARKPSPVEAMNALAGEVYGGAGPWSRRRRS